MPGKRSKSVSSAEKSTKKPKLEWKSNRMERLNIHMGNFRKLLESFKEAIETTNGAEYSQELNINMNGDIARSRSTISRPDDICEKLVSLTEKIKNLENEFEIFIKCQSPVRKKNKSKKDLYDQLESKYNNIIDFLKLDEQLIWLNDDNIELFRLGVTKQQKELRAEFVRKSDNLLDKLRSERQLDTEQVAPESKDNDGERVKKILETSPDDGQLGASTSKQELPRSEISTDPKIVAIKTEIGETLDLMETLGAKLTQFIDDSSDLMVQTKKLIIDIEQLTIRFKYLLDGDFINNLKNQWAAYMPGLIAFRDNYNNIIDELQVIGIFENSGQYKDVTKYETQQTFLIQLDKQMEILEQRLKEKTQSAEKDSKEFQKHLKFDTDA